MKIGILGLGEVGQAIKEVYLNNPEEKEFDIAVDDKASGLNEIEVPGDMADCVEFLNVCIPYSDKFEEIVESYATKYNPGVIIIHSTVPVGTTKRISDKVGRVVHSPVRGLHPDLYTGIKTFTKFIGADDQQAGELVLQHFVDLGLVCVVTDSKTSELFKLLDTTYYGLCIAYHDYANQLCEKLGVRFDDVMTLGNRSYNEGYKRLGKDNVVRPVLYAPADRKIGGHCVIPNAEILKEQFGDNEILKSILLLK